MLWLYSYQWARSNALYILRSTSIPTVFGHLENHLFSPHREPTFKPTCPTYLNYSMAFRRTSLTFRPTHLSAAHSFVERSVPQYWQFWSLFIYVSRMVILTSSFRFIILIPNIKMPNRCLAIGVRYPITLVCYFSVILEIASSVTSDLAIFMFFAAFGTNTHLFPNLICGTPSPWLKRTL
jgi:hypothetical protein